jgi:chromosome segregation ATPase
MPPEERKPEQPQGTPAAAPLSNAAPTAEEHAAIKAELDLEKKAIAAAQAAITNRDKRITELQASVSAIQQAGETAMAELTQAKGAYTKAVSKYLEMTKAANPTIPPDVITGATIEDIDASVTKALSIATAVKASLEAQAKEAKVPAGAPPRGEISLEGLSPKEKIAAGIKRKGGTS